MLVIVASFYANIKSDWSASEAADNSEILEALERMDKRLARIEAALTEEGGE